MITKQPWHRQETETAKAFHAFMLYREMLPVERSLEKTRESLGKKRGYIPVLEHWSSKYQWVARTLAHDEHRAEVRSQAQEAAIKEMTERHVKEGMELQQKGLEYFQSEKVEKARDAIRAVTDGAKLERLARGEPTEISKGELTLKAKPLHEYTDEELDRVIAQGERLIEGKAEAGIEEER